MWRRHVISMGSGSRLTPDVSLVRSPAHAIKLTHMICCKNRMDNNVTC